MLITHATVSFAHMSGLVRDEVVNTWCFSSETDIDGPAQATIAGALNNFYQVIQPHGVSVGQVLGNQLSRTVQPVLRFYDIDGHLNGSASGSPVGMALMTVLPNALSPNELPTEVALCLSFNADYGTDVEFGTVTRPRQRDRGRIFIGPLIQTVVDVDGTTKKPKPSASVQNSLVDAGAQLPVDLTAAIQWNVWSRRNATIKPVTTVSVDDAFDTQRRRGERALSRASAGVL